MKKLFRERKWLVVVAVAALATPVVAAGVAFATATADPNDYVRSVEYVKAVSSSTKAATKSISVNCPSPKKAIGGGASTSVSHLLVADLDSARRRDRMDRERDRAPHRHLDTRGLGRVRGRTRDRRVDHVELEWFDVGWCVE